MQKLLRLIWWDCKLIIKSGIVAVAFGITALYLLIIHFGGLIDVDQWIIVLLISDPVMYGFLFSAVIVLFEKDINIHQVFAIVPLPKVYYLVSKATVFAILALVCCLPIVAVYKPFELSWLFIVLAIILSAIVFSLIGIIGALLSQNFNQFILTIPLVLAPVTLPFLSFFKLMESNWFYLLPTQACLILFEAGFKSMGVFQIIYALFYLITASVLLAIWGAQIIQRKV